uniref:Metallo-beta-lactamase domain-containing protein n=1 Tax=Noctiluca scintillans TaxID=2966 RepID=A0A7S1F294_NOCSC|mmetsp:Transcript_27820/g.73492  ORF Transcript_27820/g.73492 Transcript_27820/m.73492 type:complete len:345 (+) Transcript_27820:71-1105(+)
MLAAAKDRGCVSCGALAHSFWRPPLVAKPCACSCLRGLAVAAKDVPPELPEVERLSSRVARVLGRNPGPFTLTGTNMYLVGTGKKRILVDAGEGRPGVLQDLVKLMDEEGCGLDQIVVTHWHHDHILGVPEILRHFGAVPVRKYMPPEGTGGRKFVDEFDPEALMKEFPVVGLEDGEVLSCEGASVRVLFTPGHANDHVSLMLEEEQSLFTGDNVLGWGTGVFEDLQQYLASLRRMRDTQPTVLYPAHGPVIQRGRAGPWLEMYISHRETRVQQVKVALNGSSPAGVTLQDVTREVYKAQTNVLSNDGLFKGACNNTLHILTYLVKEGLCREIDGSYLVRAAQL